MNSRRKKSPSSEKPKPAPRRLISAPNAGRDNLYKFMRHWLASRLARERLALYRHLPSSFSLGIPLRGRLKNRAPL